MITVNLENDDQNDLLVSVTDLNRAGSPVVLNQVRINQAESLAVEIQEDGHGSGKIEWAAQQVDHPTKTVQAPGVTGFGLATQATYDPLYRVKDTTDPKLGVTQFNYDGLDRPLKVTDPRNLVTQSPRTGLGDATQLISPDTGTAALTYDAAGNLKTRLDSRGVLATYSYDALNRLTSVVYSKTGSSSTTYSWGYDLTGSGYANGIGRLSRTDHPSGSSRYLYDPQGRLVQHVQNVLAATGANTAAVLSTTSYGYDAAGHLTSLTYPSGRQVRYTYTAGQLSAIGLAPSATGTLVPMLGQILWEPFGAVSSWQWQMATGTQANSKVYDSYGRLVRYQLSSLYRDLTYDAADRITSYKHYPVAGGAPATSFDQSFVYDELGRLKGITTATASWTIGYDANGNRTSVTLNGSTNTYVTPATSNKLTSTSNPARSFGYDAAGNTTSDTGGYTATYDLAGRLATLTKASITSTYSYDANGQRIRKFSSSGVASASLFVYDQNNGQLLGEYSSTGVPIREYVWLGGTPVAIFTPDAVNAANPPVAYYVITDHLDTPRMVINKANQRRWRWLAEPFGTTAPENNPDGLGVFAQNLRFPGQFADSESGLSYNYFRNYDSTIGRYTQSDPIGLDGGINTYSYVSGNPVSYVDEHGLMGGGGYSAAHDWQRFPSGDFVSHGRYCGPGWTGGRHEEYSPGHENLYFPPTDDLDKACRTHDICYYTCREANPCNPEGRSQCFLSCDGPLAISASSIGGLDGYKISGVMRRPEKRDPGPNRPSCSIPAPPDQCPQK